MQAQRQKFSKWFENLIWVMLQQGNLHTSRNWPGVNKNLIRVDPHIINFLDRCYCRLPNFGRSPKFGSFQKIAQNFYVIFKIKLIKKALKKFQMIPKHSEQRSLISLGESASTLIVENLVFFYKYAIWCQNWYFVFLEVTWFTNVNTKKSQWLAKCHLKKIKPNPLKKFLFWPKWPKKS